MDDETVVGSAEEEVLVEVLGSGSRDVKGETPEFNEGMGIDTEESGKVNEKFTDEPPSSGLVVTAPSTSEGKTSSASLLCFMRRREPSETSDCAPETTKESVDNQRNVRLRSKRIFGVRRSDGQRRGKG